MSGQSTFSSTYLTADIDDDDTTITVADTTGFPTPGIIVIGSERIAYSQTSATTFYGNTAQPLTRGSSGTDAAAHLEDAEVRTVEGSLVNSAIDYNIAMLSDAAGWTAFITVPLALFNTVKSFAVAPFGFLGSDLQILTIIWGIAFLGMVVAFFIAVIGGRRV